MRGTITGYAKLGDETIRELGSWDDVRKVASDTASVLWVDVEAPDEAGLAPLAELFRVNQDSLSDCIGGEQRPRIDEYDDHLFMVFYGLRGAEGEDIEPRKLGVFFSPRFLITVHMQSLRTIKEVRQRYGRMASQYFSTGADSILYHIIDGMVDRYLDVVATYEDELEGLEDSALEADVDEDVLVRAGQLRRQLLRVRTLAHSQRELLAPVVRGEFEYLSESLQFRFAHVVDHLVQVIEQIDTLRELIVHVRENFHAELATRTNESMQKLTVLATITLPLTLIAGIYGMNLPLWPPPEDPLSFWGVVGAMALLAGGMLVYFKRIKWL